MARRLRRDSLEARLLVWILPIALAATLVISGANYLIARGVILGETQKGIAAVTEAAAAEAKGFFDQRHADLATIAQSPLFRDHYMNVEYGLAQEAGVYRREIARMLVDLQRRTGAYPRLTYLDAAGREVCVVADGEARPPGAFDAADFFARVRGLGRGRRLVSPIARVPWHASPVVRFGTPLRDEAGRFRGALVFAVSLQPIYDSLGRLHLGVSGRSYLSERGGPRYAGGRSRLMTSEAAVAGTPWSVVTAVDRGDFLGRLAWFNTLFFALLFAAAAALVLAISRRVRLVLRPLAALSAAAEAYAGGDLEARVAASGEGEVAALAESFNVMADRLKARTEDLVQRVRELTALQRMNDAVLRRLGRDSIAEACLEAAVSGLGFERGVLFWVDEARGELRGACGRGLEGAGLTTGELRRRRVPLDGAGAIPRAARLREPVIVSDGGDGELEGRSLCAIPVMARDAAVAVLCLSSPSPSLAAAKARGIALFAGAAGLALENARLLEAVVESEARYRTAVEHSPHAVVGLDQNLRITLWNRRAEALFGYQPAEAYGRTLELVLGAEGWRRVERGLDTEGALHQAEASGATRDGRTLDLSLSAAARAAGAQGAREWFVVMQDETEKNRLQSQLVQAEKMTAVGSLITGITHELNNPLTVVIGHADALQHLPGTPEEKEDLRQLYQSALRCRDIVAGLLLFARKGKGQRCRLSLNEVVRASLALYEYRLIKTEDIKLAVELDPAQPQVAGEFSKLQQVLVNVLANACDALQDRPRPWHILVRTRARADGSAVEIEDNGPGVPAHKRAAVFEPFYTTKPVGRGTGLGLSISAEIMRDAGGTLRCEEGRAWGGARFVAEFPPCPEGLPEPFAAVQLPPPVPGRRVLVVDDEPDVTQLMRRILVEDGLQCRAATDAEGALRLLREEACDLLIADVDLGPAKGTVLVEAARALARPPAVLLVTGNVLGLAAEAAALGVPVLAKPFLRTEFLRAVRRALRSAAPAG